MSTGKILFILISASAVLGLYQNCSQSQFSGAVPAADAKATNPYGNSVLTAEPAGSAEGNMQGAGTPAGNAAEGNVNGTGGGQVAGPGDDADPTTTDHDDSSAPEKNNGKDNATDGNHVSNGNSGNAGSEGSADESSGLVECMLGGPSLKIIVANGDATAVHGHGGVKVCMTAHACLDLINAYAADRNCTLVPGAATTLKSGKQCTGRFPGSQGTCKKPSYISDADVKTLLGEMAKK